MSTSILVTGGTGTLGRVLVDRLTAAHHDIAVLSRRSGPGRVVGDLRTGTGVDDAVRGAGVIVHAATGPRGDATLTRTLIDAVRRGGHRPHLIYVSIVGIDRLPLGYYREKLAAEDLVKSSDLPWTIQRATQFHDLVAGLIGALSRSPVVPVLTQTRFQPIDVRDLADRLVHLAENPARGWVADMGGPQIRTMQDLTRSWLAAGGRRRAIAALRPPGALASAFRAGLNLTPDHAEGVITFEDYLAGRSVVRP